MMNRKILFRGKKIINGEWVEGDLFHHGEQMFIMAANRNTEVDPSTVGQYTGLTDKNGVKIFEGDIVRYYNSVIDLQRFIIAKIGWDERERGFVCVTRSRVFREFMYEDLYEVIGNIHDNPELLERGENHE